MKQAKGKRGKCDVLASKITRSIGYCERCGNRNNLQCSHIVSRRYSATRSDLDNLQCLCAGCHMFFNSHPVEFTEWIYASIGKQKYVELKQKAETVTKVDWDAEYQRLKGLWKTFDEKQKN